jgi:hypothetical protein
VLLAAINRGQLLAILGFVVVLALVIRMPSEEAGKIAEGLLGDLELHTILGYLLFLAALIGWYAHARAQRRWISGEMSRIAEEKTTLQEAKIGTKLSTSERK